MLILQRKKSESITIDNNITLSIIDISSDWVKIAIDAPKDVKILRTELIEAANINHEASNLTNESITAFKKAIKKLP